MSRYGSSNSNAISFIMFGILLCIPAVVWCSLSIYNGVVFGIHCEGHLKRAADANTVDMASKELADAIKYLEDNKMTEGYTSVLWNTPSADVGFFYQNLKSSLEELKKVTPETAQLERTNVLMKLRETLLDHGDSGDSVTCPSGISVFPNNAAYFWTGWLVLILGGIGFVLAIVGFAQL